LGIQGSCFLWYPNKRLLDSMGVDTTVPTSFCLLQKRLDVTPCGVLFFVGALPLCTPGCHLPHTCCLQLDERRGIASTVVIRQCVKQANKSGTCFISPLLQMKVPVLCLFQYNGKNGSKCLIEQINRAVFFSYLSAGIFRIVSGSFIFVF
jgi:hypothetical protein